MKLTNASFLICIFLCVTPLTDLLAAATPARNTDGMDRMQHAEMVEKSGSNFPLADSLFRAGNYFAASVEYERAYYFAPDVHSRTLANLAKVQALKQMGEFEKAWNDIQRSLPFTSDRAIRADVLYETALCAYLNGAYRESLLMIGQLQQEYGAAETFDSTWLLTGLDLMQLEEWEELKAHVNERIAVWPAPGQLADVDELVALLHESQQPRIKNPAKARLYATFFPGMGHFYTAEVGKGILNASSQLLSIGGAALLAVNTYYISAFTIGLSMFQSFYFGGIKQAGTLTQLRNEKKMKAYKQLIGEKLLETERIWVEQSSEMQTSDPEYFLEQTLLALYRFDFKRADSVSQTFYTTFPGHYLAHVARTHYHWWMIISQPENIKEEEGYRTSISNALSGARKQYDQGMSDHDLFYLISMYAMQARLDLKKGAYIRAIRNGRQAINHMELSKKREEAFPAFYLTSGLYNYMTEQAVRQYPFLKIYSLFYPDGDRELGLAQLQRVTQAESFIWKTEAHYFLMRIYLETEQAPELSLVHARWLTDRYPSNMIFQYYHWLVLKELRDWEGAEAKKSEIRLEVLKNQWIGREQKAYFLNLLEQ